MELPLSSSPISVNNERSPQEIHRLIQKRVHERNQWTVNGVMEGDAMRGFKEARKFATSVLPKFMRFKPPTEAELDAAGFHVLKLDWDRLQNPRSDDDIQITWLGHSSLLVQMGNVNILTDPVFSQRCAPTQWFGPKRLRPTPCGTVQELCKYIDIDLVLVSHNHYDHLDYHTVQDICKYASNTVRFVVPLGLQGWFRKYVSKDIPIYEKDWYEYMEIKKNTNSNHHGGIRVTTLPMRHWSNRLGVDRDKTLWCGYSVEVVGDLLPSTSDNNNNSTNAKTTTKKFLFPGDTAWFDKLHDLGQDYGPWDVAAIPIGAYEPRDFMKYNHINVDEAIQMKDAVNAKCAVPIHWGTFPLTVEPVLEPREKLVELMKNRPDAGSFVPWLVGETKQF